MAGPLHQKIVDGSAIGLSMICIAHCLAVPLAIVIFPIMGLTVLAHEFVHVWLFLGAAALSAFAFTSGYRRHRGWGMIAAGVLGLMLMLVGALHGLVEPYEEVVTLIGVCLVSAAHLNNWYRHTQLIKRAGTNLTVLSEPTS